MKSKWAIGGGIAVVLLCACIGLVAVTGAIVVARLQPADSPSQLVVQSGTATPAMAVSGKTAVVAAVPTVVLAKGTPILPTKTAVPPTKTPAPPTATPAVPTSTPALPVTTINSPLGKVTGLILDENTKQPVAQIPIQLVRATAVRDGRVYLEGTPVDGNTDTAGRFVFEEVRPDDYTLIAYTPGLSLVRDAQGRSLVVEVVAGRAIDLGTVSLVGKQ